MLSLTEIFFNDFTTPFSFGAGMFDYLDYNVKVYIKPKQNLRIFKK
jgi:hypothetical protein